MRNPFRSFYRFATGAVLSLLVIITILLGYRFLSAEYAKYETLAQEQSSLRQVKRELESVRDNLAKDLPSRIPQAGTPANRLAERIKALESELGNRQLARQKLWADHPVERYLPTSDSFRKIAALDIEIAFLQQALAYVRNLHAVTAGPVEAERRIQALQADSSRLAEQIYHNKKAQWDLSRQAPLLWQVPYANAYRQMKRWEEEARLLQSTKAQHDAELVRQQGLLQAFQKLPQTRPAGS
jgi:DNA repair exonuclease SbcCD ATPase subunit